ncbi:hypothetical protein ACFQHW_09080 [Lapidilactobacillus achengensis]|uniref:Phage shock protein G n=1 Tax=Lapidilactobacillus achengensis TaxID=2486000 RepID=A0ABW1UR10_9LACO|nr:hypothetical protein [Lapidilactobacillus achengensis]
MLTLILLLIFIPILLIVVFSLIAGAVGLVWGMLKFLLPVIIIAALINLVFSRHRRESRTRPMTYESYDEHQSVKRPRKDLHDVHVHDQHANDDDEWSDF